MIVDLKNLGLGISRLRQHYMDGDFTPAELLQALRNKARDYADYGIWIHLLSDSEIEPYLTALKHRVVADLPLYGVPFAIKDNLDLAGVPTTAACPDFAYTPQTS